MDSKISSYNGVVTQIENINNESKYCLVPFVECGDLYIPFTCAERVFLTKVEKQKIRSMIKEFAEDWVRDLYTSTKERVISIPAMIEKMGTKKMNEIFRVFGK